MLDMNALKIVAINVGIFCVSGVLLFAPLVNFLNRQLGKNVPPITYKIGLLWGICTGLLFGLRRANIFSFTTLLLVCGGIIVCSFVYRKMNEKK